MRIAIRLAALVVFALSASAIYLFLPSDTPARCHDYDCFADAFAECEPAAYGKRLNNDAFVQYAIEGESAEGCRLSMTYESYPDKAWDNKPATFVLDTDKSLREQLTQARNSCQSGDDQRFDCAGPLYEFLVAHPASRIEWLDADAAPCGTSAPLSEAKPLYRMRRDGKWGYVNGSAKWVIEPQWEHARDFSEGRAVVYREKMGWGIIEENGEYVQKQVRGRTELNSYGPNKGPIEPFSEGCAVVRLHEQFGPPSVYYVTRKGKYWRPKPAGLDASKLADFGPFSEGKAWFKLKSSDFHDPDSFGWINTRGEVEIEPKFTSSLMHVAGNFVEGKAPVAIENYKWAYIDERGQRVWPAQEPFQRAHAFSGGRAAVKSTPFGMTYTDGERIVIDEVRFDPTRDINGRHLERANIQKAGSFSNGLAPVELKNPGDGKPWEPTLVYIDPDGKVLLVPQQHLKRKVCYADKLQLPEFKDGLLRLSVAPENASCGKPVTQKGRLDDFDVYGNESFIYIDAKGAVVLDEEA